MATIALTGGIGSGKSTVARILETLGYPVYYSDREANRLVATDPEIRRELTRQLGAHLYDTEGTPDKKALAALLFTDKKALHTANRIIHPAVMRDFLAWTTQQKAPLLFFESAIIYEAGLAAHFQAVIEVYADTATRIARVVARDHTTPEKVRERMANQWAEEKKRELADHVIDNGEEKMVLAQLLRIVDLLKQQLPIT